MANKLPPPVITSAKVLFFAHNDHEVKFTDKLSLYVSSTDGGMQRLGEMPNLAICRNYGNPDELLLLFCGDDWDDHGVISNFHSVEEAKLRAEHGYNGISEKWNESPYSEDELRDFLRYEYEVDPETRWWETICSFCGKRDAVLSGAKASICRECVISFYQHLNKSDA